MSEEEEEMKVVVRARAGPNGDLNVGVEAYNLTPDGVVDLLKMAVEVAERGPAFVFDSGSEEETEAAVKGLLDSPSWN